MAQGLHNFLKVSKLYCEVYIISSEPHKNTQGTRPCVFEILFALHFTKVPGSAIGGLGLTGLFLQIFLNLGNYDAV